jgi:glycosyltransferase involved in cell wall biosynthesis
MKVLQFIASKGWGGAEKSFVELCNGLSHEIRVEVLLFKENAIEHRLDPHIKVHYIFSGTGRHNPLLYLELGRLVKHIEPDIVHTHSAKASEIIYFLSRFITLTQVATKRNPRKGKIFNRIKHVTAISQNVANSIGKDDVEVIYNGLLKERVPNEEVGNRVFTLLAVGRLDKIKGFDLLIKETASLSFPFHLNIVGEGEEREILEKLILRLGLTDKVSLLGHREDIASLIARANVVVISSLSEGFGRVVVETLFYGKLLLSTKVGLSNEILPKALLVDNFAFAKKLEEVYANEQHFDTLFLEVQQKWREPFVLHNSIENYKTFYQKIIKQERHEKV